MAIEATQPQLSPHTPPLPHSPSADVIVRNGRPVDRELSAAVRLQVEADLHLVATGPCRPLVRAAPAVVPTTVSLEAANRLKRIAPSLNR